MKTERVAALVPPAGDTPAMSLAWRVFAVWFGLLLGLSLLKFGNPPAEILEALGKKIDRFFEPPANGLELFLNAWPAVWGYWLLGAASLAGLAVARLRTKLPWWLLLLPLIWLAWQFLALTHSVNARLSWAVCVHFATCVTCFYLGLLALGRSPDLGLFSLGLMTGFLLVMVSGFSQHFGGLQATRDYFFQYIYPADLHNLDPGYVKKMSSTRIFATLFYPNTLAGVILMLLPVILGVIGAARKSFTVGARGLLMGIVTAGALGCLYWSGSKGGWLLMLGLGFGAVLFLPIRRKWKLALVVVVLAGGLTGFFWKYAGFFKKGATSVVARFDYWEAAGKTFRAHPVLGSGPGTFGIAYAKIRRPESEMALVAHNDYLQQASDSGAVGCLAFTGFMAGALVFAGRRVGRDWLKIAVWLGLLGWALQGLVEFGLYIPAVAWPGFALLGWLLAQAAQRTAPTLP